MQPTYPPGACSHVLEQTSSDSELLDGPASQAQAAAELKGIRPATKASGSTPSSPVSVIAERRYSRPSVSLASRAAMEYEGEISYPPAPVLRQVPISVNGGSPNKAPLTLFDKPASSPLKGSDGLELLPGSTPLMLASHRARRLSITNLADAPAASVDSDGNASSAASHERGGGEQPTVAVERRRRPSWAASDLDPERFASLSFTRRQTAAAPSPAAVQPTTVSKSLMQVLEKNCAIDKEAAEKADEVKVRQLPLQPKTPFNHKHVEAAMSSAAPTEAVHTLLIEQQLHPGEHTCSPAAGLTGAGVLPENNNFGLTLPDDCDVIAAITDKAWREKANAAIFAHSETQFEVISRPRSRRAKAPASERSGSPGGERSKRWNPAKSHAPLSSNRRGGSSPSSQRSKYKTQRDVALRSS